MSCGRIFSDWSRAVSSCSLSSDDDAPDGAGTGELKSFGALFERAPGGGHIIHEPNIFSREGIFVFIRNGESAGEILEPFFTSLGLYLRLGKARSDEESVEDGDLELRREILGEGIGEELGLVETPVAEAPRVKRNGENRVREGEGIVGEGALDEGSERKGEVFDKAVLEGVDGALDEAILVRNGDEEAVESSFPPALLAHCAIGGIGHSANGAFLGIALRDAIPARVADELSFSTAPEADNGKESVNDDPLQANKEASG